jgi:hypothetical protein
MYLHFFSERFKYDMNYIFIYLELISKKISIIVDNDIKI